jgi:hypothetical protein
MQQQQFGGGGAPQKRKGGAKDFLALVGQAPMGTKVIPAGAEFPPSPTDVTGMTGATGTNNGVTTGAAS